MGLGAESVREGRSQWPVDEPSREGGLLCGPAFTTEERSGDPPNGVHPLFNIHGQREEVNAFAQPLVGGRRHEDFGVADTGNNGPIGELGKRTGAQFDLDVADTAANGGLCHASSPCIRGGVSPNWQWTSLDGSRADH